MLKYNDIIKKLSDSEKIRMLCDIRCLSGKNYRALGIPEFNITTLEDIEKDTYPSPVALSNTWDTELTGKVADNLFGMASLFKGGLVKVPAPRVRINPYRQALSEDPLLASAMSRAYIDAAQRADTAIGLADFGLFNEEPEWMDEQPDERFIHEFLVKPYTDATRGKTCTAVFTKENITSQSYGTVNTDLMDTVTKKGVVQDATPICTRVSAENTVKFLANGGLFLEGSALAVESALSKYKKLTEDIARGHATTEELNGEVARGKAISPEALDGAVDRRHLRDIVFADGETGKAALSDLNRISHAAVLDECRAWLSERSAEGAVAAVINAPLLLESGFHTECDAIVAVLADETVRVARLTERDGLTEAEARQRINRQASDATLNEHADFILRNNGTEAELWTQVLSLKEYINNLAKEQTTG